jgi:hypothetical protein
MTTFNQDGTSAGKTAHSLPQPEPDPSIQLDVPPELDVEVEVETTTAGVEGGSEGQLNSAIADLAADHADDPRVFDAEVITADQDDEPTSTAVALAPSFDVTKTGEVWDHDFLVFKEDKLGIRVPTRQALAAFSLASGKYVDIGVKNDLTGLFIARHLSPESYGRVFSRLMDPDETDYDVDTVGELFNAIVTASLQEPTTGDDKP